MARIYLASSWRNQEQPGVLRLLRDHGHDVYDFRNPRGKTGFAWQQLDPNWQTWTAREYRDALKLDRAQEGFRSDFSAMEWADTCVLLLPSGRSAHLEAGFMKGAGKRVFVLTRDGEEPELMALMLDCICINTKELLEVLV